ncbi:M3 family metallopeptidase [Nocardia pseudobrasiliensis]|uniref:Thimet oligopeptidase n=1 Tax=Nocardia pseudobrasiliensis TaxID=45979 RepID=A0A370I2Z9_9NOCA|nr:M3 family metallopeptidase [Nocardia pseudobrasiliensis]RDI65086.1 thimet oligopeptidase [Nocardia pseudobrasiliensis]
MSPEPLALPTTRWSDWLAEYVLGQLTTVTETLRRLGDGDTRDTEAVLALWNDADIALRGADSAALLLIEVHPEAEVRGLAEELLTRIERVRTDRDLDRALYDVVAATDPAGLDEQARRMREHVLRDFRRSGVDRDDPTRARLREISERLVVLEQQFGRTIRDDVRTVRLAPERLDGLPTDFLAAHPPAEDGLVTITTDYPDYQPFRVYARDGEARRDLTVAFESRGWPANDVVLHEILDLREEKARLLGYAGWPDYDAEVKMIGTGGAIAEFIERISTAADAAARRDLDALLARRRADEPGAAAIDRSEVGYYTELIRREQYDVDAREVRRYFDFARVRAGLLEVTGRLFGLEYRPVDVPSWHAEVTAYDVYADGVRCGRIYLDLHPREGKYKHAAQFDLVGGISDRLLPEGVLICNFSRGLMEHHEVVTLFHEFGHLIHHVLGGRQRWARFSGVATEWDFVEAPSQMLEEWAWDASILGTFAVDASGAAIPAELVERMRAAKDFGKGISIRTQVAYTAVSYLLHSERPTDHTATVFDAMSRYGLIAPLPGTHFQTAFGHLTGYTSAYYTYLWSLVIAKDLFSAFDADDLFDPVVARRYRDRILAAGGSRDAADLVAEFLGRPFAFDAFAAWLDRAPVTDAP